MSDAETKTGVSFVVCCHNSASRLPQTLSHLAAQKTTANTLWEVIVIDNASNDGNDIRAVAQEHWPQHVRVPLRVIYERRLGLNFARQRGIAESKYDLVCFVDDDNWLCNDWVEVLSQVMTKHPQIGACGGFISSVCEDAPPWWFSKYENCYSPGAQGQVEGGDVTWRGFLMGAGLTIRKSAWQQIVREGFHFLLPDRQGAKLTAGGDHEFCKAICPAGWRLWYEPRLHLKHFLPASRLDWSLFRRQARGAGRCEPSLDLYDFILKEEELNGSFSRLNAVRQSWWWQILIAARHLCRRPFMLTTSYYRPYEGDFYVLWLERQLGRFLGLLENRNSYSNNLRAIREARWRKRDSRSFSQSV